METLAFILQLQEHESFFQFQVEELRHLTYDFRDDRVSLTIFGHDFSYYSTIFSYLQDQKIPKSLTCNRKCQLILNALHYTLVFDDLQRKILDFRLIWFLEKNQSEKELSNFHDDICGLHSNFLALAHKFIRCLQLFLLSVPFPDLYQSSFFPTFLLQNTPYNSFFLVELDVYFHSYHA